MLWVIYHREEHYYDAPSAKELTRMILVSVHRFQDGDAAMKRFSLTHDQLGRASTKEGFRRMIDGRYHVLTSAHAMPEKLMMGTQWGFKLVLHQVRAGEDFVKVWSMPPGREALMTAVEYEAKQDPPETQTKSGI